MPKTAALTLLAGVQPDPTVNPISWSMQTTATHTVLTLTLTDPYLDFEAAHQLHLPQLPATHGLILSGRLPLWLVTSLVRSYALQPWLALYQPPLNGAVVIHSTEATLPIGTVLPCTWVTDH